MTRTRPGYQGKDTYLQLIRQKGRLQLRRLLGHRELLQLLLAHSQSLDWVGSLSEFHGLAALKQFGQRRLSILRLCSEADSGSAIDEAEFLPPFLGFLLGLLEFCGFCDSILLQRRFNPSTLDGVTRPVHEEPDWTVKLRLLSNNLRLDCEITSILAAG